MTLQLPPSSADAVVGGTLPAQIHGLLEEAIIAGEIPPGTRLRADDIAARYGISRIPVREALSALSAAGWVDIRPRYGVYVRDRSREELVELFEARAAIEEELARLAASRRDQDDLSRMEDIVGASTTAAVETDARALNLAAEQFNVALRRASKNSVLSAVSLLLEKRARFYFAPVADRLGGEWATGQRRLLELIRKQDVSGAAASARRHVTETGEAVASLLSSDAFTR
ncbi:GntR family transcriptional regulator [Leifsonia sp. AG29]|uniref:GntR family transcriptional regulator n=1 Tax=Leifsonia sp. AG29 TaxID=2598860 RepID=UPI00131B8259|nr:GntR family transcriptional regulator [Leifsonia sp. AG29]